MLVLQLRPLGRRRGRGRHHQVDCSGVRHFFFRSNAELSSRLSCSQRRRFESGAPALVDGSDVARSLETTCGREKEDRVSGEREATSTNDDGEVNLLSFLKNERGTASTSTKEKRTRDRHQYLHSSRTRASKRERALEGQQLQKRVISGFSRFFVHQLVHLMEWEKKKKKKEEGFDIGHGRGWEGGWGGEERERKKRKKKEDASPPPPPRSFVLLLVHRRPLSWRP